MSCEFEVIFSTSALGLEGCIEQVWRDTVVYIDDDNPVFIGRPYGRVSRHLLHEELVKRLNYCLPLSCIVGSEKLPADDACQLVVI